MFFTYCNINMYYEIIGEGRPVLLLHGLSCDLSMMKGCMEPIFKNMHGYKRFYIDLPGMGKSDSPKHFASSDKILEILISFTKSIIGERFLLVGESYGGYLARGILSKIESSVEGLMLLCPVVIPESDKRNIPNKIVRSIDEVFLKKLEEKDRNQFCEYSVIANEKVHERYCKEILSGIEKANDEFIDLLEKRYAFSFDVDKCINKSKFIEPALFITARQDTSVGYKDLWKIIDDYERATYAVIDMAGHNVQIEQPELFNSLVENWLIRLEKI